MPSSSVRTPDQPPSADGNDGHRDQVNRHNQLDTMTTQHDDAASASASAPAGFNDGSEHSPLLSSDTEEATLVAAGDAALPAMDLENNTSHGDDYHQRTKSVWYLILLTISIGGLQIAWSVELSNGSPYLLSLGLSKSLMALVWIAGPLSGTLVQPYVGMLSDNCRVSWGKRKPFMLAGAAATMVSLMCLAWTKELVAGPLKLLFGADPASDGVRVAVIVVAVIWVYVLDFSINTVQAAIRAFIVDCAPAHQQEAANAMASRITGVGNIIGYVAGYADLPRITWWLGDTQFKDLCAIASIALGSTVVLSCALIRERDPRREGPLAAHKQPGGVVSFFRKIFVSIRRLPPQIRKVCQVQFCAWVGFFPMLFYTSSYIGEIYVEPFLEANPHMTPAELDKLYEQATRVGTFALLIYSITSLCTNVFLPFFIAPTYDTEPRDGQSQPQAAAAAAAFSVDSQPAPKTWLDRLVIPGFTLRRAWMYSLLLFSGSMFCTVLVSTVAAATVLIGLVGITWALTLWAPWAIISAEISHRDAQRRAARDGRDATSDDDGDVDQAGVILGIHNMAIAAPQIIATVGSSIIFKFLQKPRGTPGDHSIAVVMALGGITVLLAAYFVHKIEDEADAEINADGDLVPVEGPYYAAVARGDVDEDDEHEHEHGHGHEARGGSEDGDESTNHKGLGRRVSSEQLCRASLERATAARNSSFGSGLEY